ncbi:hypothetical protein ACWFMI_19565 [Nocardiopsis terrae]
MSSRTAQPDFLDAVERLMVPGMGTEALAPLLADLVRFLRPRRVLEVGMGYTTPFLAAALADTEEAARKESEALAAKSREHMARGALGDEWLLADPALVTPSEHLEPHTPRLVALDDLSMDDSSAPDVLNVLEELHLTRLVEVVNTELTQAHDILAQSGEHIDFAWVDAWECLYFFDHFWELIDPDGGLVVMHYLSTYPEGEALLRYIRGFQSKHPGEIEVVNLLERHKLMQNSITVLRRTSSQRPRRYARTGGRVDYSEQLHADAKAHLNRHPRT